MHVEYSSNNSGGSWWLDDKDWQALESAGWEVQWVKDDPSRLFANGDRFLGALATNAIRRDLGLREAVAEWERITGQDATDEGCPCCGHPHMFYQFD
jgi:hypothetical protein